MKRIAITGGAGFIGSHLCKRLLAEGNEIFCIDNFYTGRNENISEFKNHKNFHLIMSDISKPINFCSRLDEIYNLACPASPPHYQRDPISTIKTNVLGMINMLELAMETGAKILQASTSEIYGDPFEHPQTESYWGNVNPIGVRSCYDEGKRIAETLCFDFLRQHNIDVKVIRIFNTYGPNMDKNDGRVISNFIVQALRNEDITIYGSGSQSRSFQYIDDLINGMILVMNSKNNGPYNIGNPSEFSMLEIANIIKELTNSKSILKYAPLPKDDPKQRKPDISKMKLDFGWEPIIDVITGIKKTIDYFKNVI